MSTLEIYDPPLCAYKHPPTHDICAIDEVIHARCGHYYLTHSPVHGWFIIYATDVAECLDVGRNRGDGWRWLDGGNTPPDQFLELLTYHALIQ